MTTPDVPDPAPFVEPDEVLADSPVDVDPLAVEAAKAEMDQEARDNHLEALSRSWRTVLQGAVSVALMAGANEAYTDFTGGHHDWKFLAFAAAQAALTAVASYLHKRFGK